MARFLACLVWLALGSVGAATDSPSPTREPLVASKPPTPATTVEEAELERMKAKLAAIVRSGSATDLADELARIDRRLKSLDLPFEERAVALEECFRAIATVTGGHLPQFRAVCRPYAVEIASHQPSEPVSEKLAKAQFVAFFNYVRWGASGGQPTAAERFQVVEPLLRIWDRAEASFQARQRVWKETQALFEQSVDFGVEDVRAGRRFLLPLPLKAPESVKERVYKYPHGIDPASIEDPEVRKALEDLSAAERRRSQKFGDAWEVFLVMEGYDDSSRQFLAEVYGPDFPDAPEFREAVARVIEDEDQTQRIIDRFRPQP